MRQSLKDDFRRMKLCQVEQLFKHIQKNGNLEIISKQKLHCRYALLAFAQLDLIDPWRFADNPLLRTKKVMLSIKKNKNPERVAVSKFSSSMASLGNFVRNRDDPKRSSNSRHTNHSISESFLRTLKDGPFFNLYPKKLKTWSFAKVSALDLIPSKQLLFKWIGAMEMGSKMGMLTQGKTKF